jgi:hypothetical protein
MILDGAGQGSFRVLVSETDHRCGAVAGESQEILVGAVHAC